MSALIGSNPIELFYQIQCVAYVQVAVTVAIFYDHFTTWDLEVELVWKRKWTVVTVLFIINRYLGDFLPLYLTSELILSPSPGGKCNPAVVKVMQWGCHFMMWSMQAIMQYRICCMYKHSRRLIVLVVGGFIVEILSMLAIDFLYLLRITVGIEPLPGVHMCVSYPTNWYFVAWLPVFGYELITLLLGLRAGISYYKESRFLPFKFRRHPLHFILLRDSILYPILAFVVGVINVVGWSSPMSSSTPVASGLLHLFARILGCRLILNLREAYYLPLQEECDLDDKLQTLAFDHSNDEIATGERKVFA